MKPWWLRLARYGCRHWPGLGAVTGLMLATVASEALKPWPLKLLVDDVVPGRDLPAQAGWLEQLPAASTRSGLVAWLAAGSLVLFVLGTAAPMLQRYLLAGIGGRMSSRLGADLLDRVQRRSLQFHHSGRRGDLLQRVTRDTRCLQDLLAGVALPILTALTSLAVMFWVMYRLDRVLALLALAVALPLWQVMRRFAGPMTDRNYRQYQLEAEMTSLAEQTLTSLPIVQAFTRERFEERRFRSLSDRTVRAFVGATVAQLRFKVTAGGVMAAGTAIVTAYGGIHVLQGRLTVGGLLVLLSYLASLYAPLETLTFVAWDYASAAAGARRVLEVLDQAPEVRDRPGALPLLFRPQGLVRLEGVTFGYEPGRPVVRDVTLEARPGQLIAIVGPTGAGKSTLVSLVPRFFDPWQGRVTLDGVDVRDIRLASLRAKLSVVHQDGSVLPLTVAENIAYGRPGASRREVVAAAVAASADQFIRRLPRGYDSVVGERGMTLSGGERQRLAIARALLRDAPVLILDEPTSALDAATEASLLEALRRLVAGRTTFVIAHRLSTVQLADRVVVMDRGAVAESGTIEELLAAGGMYHRLHTLQFGDPQAASALPPRVPASPVSVWP